MVLLKLLGRREDKRHGGASAVQQLCADGEDIEFRLLGVALDVLIGASPIALDRVAEGLQEDGAAKFGDDFVPEILTGAPGESAPAIIRSVEKFVRPRRQVLDPKSDR